MLAQLHSVSGLAAGAQRVRKPCFAARLCWRAARAWDRQNGATCMSLLWREDSRVRCLARLSSMARQDGAGGCAPAQVRAAKLPGSKGLAREKRRSDHRFGPEVIPPAVVRLCPKPSGADGETRASTAHRLWIKDGSQSIEEELAAAEKEAEPKRGRKPAWLTYRLSRIAKGSEDRKQQLSASG